jgi:hypothetical protein
MDDGDSAAIKFSGAVRKQRMSALPLLPALAPISAYTYSFLCS